MGDNPLNVTDPMGLWGRNGTAWNYTTSTVGGWVNDAHTWTEQNLGTLNAIGDASSTVSEVASDVATICAIGGAALAETVVGVAAGESCAGIAGGVAAGAAGVSAGAYALAGWGGCSQGYGKAAIAGVSVVSGFGIGRVVGGFVPKGEGLDLMRARLLGEALSERASGLYNQVLHLSTGG